MTRRFEKCAQAYPIQKLVNLFEQTFRESERTLLVPGALEPFYRPANHDQDFHEIHFVGTSFASALHELSHWCIAGKERRKQEDYGYFYNPEGRTPAQQAEFERFESLNQGLEWIFASCCEMRFFTSLDDFNNTSNRKAFRHQVHLSALQWLERGLPKRANAMREILISAYSCADTFNSYWHDVREYHILPE